MASSDLSQEDIDPSSSAVELSSATPQEATVTAAAVAAGLPDQQLHERIQQLEARVNSLNKNLRGRLLVLKDELRRRNLPRETKVLEAKEERVISDEGSETRGVPVLLQPLCDERGRKNEYINNEGTDENYVRCCKRILRVFTKEEDVTSDDNAKRVKIIKKYIIEDLDAEDDKDDDAEHEVQIEIADGTEKSMKLSSKMTM